MKEILEDLSTREISILFWSTVIFSIFAYTAKKEFVKVLKALFHYKIIIPIFGFGIYCTLVILILYKISFWNFHLLKDTLIWFFSAGLIIFFNTNRIHKTDYFIKILKDNLKVIIFLEFVLNFYTFSLTTEFIIIPIITFIAIIYEYSKYSMLKNPEHIKVNKFLKSLLSLFGIILLIFVAYRTINDYKNLLTFDNAKSLYLPSILMLLSFPFYYFLALAMIYEEFFLRINFMFNNEILRKELKKQILLKANFNLNKLTNINNNLDKKEVYERNIGEYIKTIT